MGRVSEPELSDDGTMLRVPALDTMGHEFMLYFREGEEGYELDLARLPEDIEWNVRVFQEFIDVREVTQEYLENDGYDVTEFCIELKRIVLYENDPYVNRFD